MSEQLVEQTPSRRLWVIAAVGALAFHLGCAALAYGRMNASDDGDSLGANAIEVGLEWASPHAEDSDLPPGPDVDQSVASTSVQEQKEEAKQSDLPQDTPTDTDDPDRVVTQAKSIKPKEDDPKIETQQAMPAPEQVQQVATAPQTLENSREAATTVAPNIGLGKDRQRLTADWGRKVSAYFDLHKRFPDVDKNKAAKVKVSLVLNRLGHVLSVVVAESSGDPRYDEAALEMVRRSDPVPRPPAKLTDDQFAFSLDVNFKDGKK